METKFIFMYVRFLLAGSEGSPLQIRFPDLPRYHRTGRGTTQGRHTGHEDVRGGNESSNEHYKPVIPETQT